MEGSFCKDDDSNKAEASWGYNSKTGTNANRGNEFGGARERCATTSSYGMHKLNQQ